LQDSGSRRGPRRRGVGRSWARLGRKGGKLLVDFESGVRVVVVPAASKTGVDLGALSEKRRAAPAAGELGLGGRAVRARRRAPPQGRWRRKRSSAALRESLGIDGAKLIEPTRHALARRRHHLVNVPQMPADRLLWRFHAQRSAEELIGGRLLPGFSAGLIAHSDAR
jgi:hypothetical protein